MLTRFSNIAIGNCLFIFTFFCCQDKLQAMELWQLAVQELDRLKKNISDGKVLETDRQQLQVVNYFFLVNCLKQTISSPLDGAITKQIRIIQFSFSAWMHTLQ